MGLARPTWVQFNASSGLNGGVKMSVSTCSCGGGYLEIRPRRIPCDRLLAGTWSSIPLIHPPGIGGGGSSFASKRGQPSQEKLAKFIGARSRAYSDSLPYIYIFDKLKKRTKLEKSAYQLLGRGHWMGFSCSFLVVSQPSENIHNSV